MTSVSDDRARVALVLTGGTIVSRGRDRLDHAWYFERGDRVDGARLLESVPELSAVATCREVPFRLLSSSSLTPGDWVELAALVTELTNDPLIDAVVVAHGTNTLEETALFVHLTVATTKPVVFVGAMRPLGSLGSDAEVNLLRAVAVAASSAARACGVLVVLNDLVYSARDVTKSATYRVDAFTAPDAGPLGCADADGRVIFHHRPAGDGAGALPMPAVGAPLPRVDIVVSYVGADGVLIDAAVAAGAAGIVSAGTGAGLPTPAEAHALDRAVDRGVVVCHGSRVGSGRVPSGGRWSQPGHVAAGNLQPWKARVVLMLALAAGFDHGRIQDLLDSI